LKGSGKTAFSRRGDGKCAIVPALREYLMSEALFALNVPTSRCLAVVSTGDIINRGGAKRGAFAARGDYTSLKALLNYSIDRHFSELNRSELSEEQRILTFLDCVAEKQITLIIQWLRVGFIHGVMNTDNTAICGETIDFGPCAMMGSYDEKAVFSSIDEYGRYAFGDQGKIAQWNMARLADCLLPLLQPLLHQCNVESGNESSNKKEQEQLALEKIETVIHQYKDKFDEAYYAMYFSKLGIAKSNTDNQLLVDNLLSIMQTKKLDYTQTFYQLTQSLTNSDKAKDLTVELGDWYARWLSTLEQQYNSSSADFIVQAQALMAQNNPVVIPRNHHVESILARCESAVEDSAVENSTSTQSITETINHIVDEFLSVLRSPYHETAVTKNYQDTPKDDDKYYQTFCGT